MTVTRVNFKNPKTGNYQNGWGVLINNVWTIKTYSDKIFNIDSINSKFESLKKSASFIKTFFEGEVLTN